MPRDHVLRLAAVARLLRLPMKYEALERAYTPVAELTHVFDVRRFARQKQAALAAHRSEVTGSGRLAPVMRLLVALPPWAFGLILGREWFRQAHPARPKAPRS